MNDPRFERIRNCPACGGRRFRPDRRGNIDVSALSAESVKITDSEYGKIWDLSACPDCGHLFADPSPTPAFIASLYKEVEDPLYGAEAEGRAKNFLPILRRLTRFAPAKGRLFDVGAATGIFLNEARRGGWRVDGIDASAWAARWAAERYAIPLRQGSFEEAGLPAQGFQAVTMIDLIEHTPRPRDVLAKAAEILTPGGVLCLVTPDIHSPAACLVGPRWWHLRPGHLAYFSRSSLDAALAAAGFHIVLRRRYVWTFSAHYLVSRFRFLAAFAASPRASFLKRIPIKLALGDSFEIYAVKGKPA
ncbi:MAG: class I SAM-dependent methyltransferase [Acidobacteriota bacterium]|nr:class I SAM-dependent methyltransferase [Acidobacteriota bacterium]